MKRKILLIEPNYKNKYPPMGIMKISTYYKRLGDEVTFFKGDLRELVLRDTFEMLKEQLYANDDTVFWEQYAPEICRFLKKGSVSLIEDIPGYKTNAIIANLFKYYRNFYFHRRYFEKPFRKYDRVGITTLFTFYWDITIDTINFAKKLCKNEKDVMVGGVMASILPERVYEATGIMPHVGTLHTPGELDAGSDMIIDLLPLDYSILEEVDYQYPAANAYYAYMTRGCVNRCRFCAVPKIESTYEEFLPVSAQVKRAEEQYGPKRELLLLDNNVLASNRFPDIIEDIKKAGFTKGSTYIAPNLYEIAVANLRSGQNDRGYIKSCVRQFRTFVGKYKGADCRKVYSVLKEHRLLEEHTATKKAIFATYDIVKPYFEKFYANKPKKRFVDFNQGIDARLITEENMEKLAEIPVRPVRIAFDHWELRDTYEQAVRIAVKHGHKDLSNYILYNFEDKPEELYFRLKMNVDLCEELGASIYSFPMKYHPIDDPRFFKNRDYIGRHWNRKFIRAIQAILNSTKGKIGKGKAFFEEAFGRDEEEFKKILWMPETFIIYRRKYDAVLRRRLAGVYTAVSPGDCDLANEWWRQFSGLPPEKLNKAKEIIALNQFHPDEADCRDAEILNVLSYYRIGK